MILLEASAGAQVPDDGMWGGEVGTTAATRGGSLAPGEGVGFTMPALNYFNWSH